jgi:YspA, cpYpsA-related SLOG family
MKIAIVGSRDYPDLGAVVRFVKGLPPGTVVVSGGARGVDRTAEQAARAAGFEVLIFPADWEKHGRMAGFKRNVQIVNASDEVVAFWDLRSHGTKHTLDFAKSVGKPVKII